MAEKIKTDAAKVRAAQSRDEAADMIARIGHLQRERDRIAADMNDVMAEIKQRHEDQALPLAEEILALTEGVHIWCEANREDLTNGNKVKSANLSSGEVRWRMRPAKVIIRNAEQVIERLKALGLKRFVRTKEEINKDAIREEPGAVKTIKGITLKKGEDFVIVPFETELEEVA